MCQLSLFIELSCTHLEPVFQLDRCKTVHQSQRRHCDELTLICNAKTSRPCNLCTTAWEWTGPICDCNDLACEARDRDVEADRMLHVIRDIDQLAEHYQDLANLCAPQIVLDELERKIADTDKACSEFLLGKGFTVSELQMLYQKAREVSVEMEKIDWKVFEDADNDGDENGESDAVHVIN